MNIAKIKKVLSTALVYTLVMAMSLAMSFSPAAYASAPPTGTAITDIYSSWAEDDIFMAQYVYNLGSEGAYSNFQGNLYTAKFALVLESLATALKTEINFDMGESADTLTRGQVVAMLYNLLSGGSGDALDEDEAVDFFVGAGLLYGRAQGDYQLDEVCTVEEMIVLVSRAYNYAIYEAGNYSVGFFWEAKGAANNVYLLGSIHMSDDSLYPMSKPIELAFARSNNLLVEVNIAELTAEDEAYILEKAYLDPSSGKTIADLISADTYDLLIAVCELLEMPEDVYLYAKPWMLTNNLTIYLMAGSDEQAMVDNASQGIDMYFLTRAVATGKNILQLESLAAQIDMMDSYSEELQEMQLIEVLQMIIPPDVEGGAGDVDAAGDVGDSGDADIAGDSGDADAGEADLADCPQPDDLSALFQMALDIIKTGDDATFVELFGIDAEIEDPLLLEYNNKLFKERDLEMAKNISVLLDDETYNGDYFIVVGAGHLISKNGVVAQLKDMGYEVNRIK